jgi:hypothetical protein
LTMMDRFFEDVFGLARKLQRQQAKSLWIKDSRHKLYLYELQNYWRDRFLSANISRIHI